MLLSEVKNHLRSQRQLSLAALSQCFNVDSAVMREMLKILIRKGQVQKCLKTPRCGSKCSQCDILTIEMYQWIV